MNFSEVKTLVWKFLGEPTDLRPTITLGGTAASISYMNLLVNSALKQLSVYKDPVTRERYRDFLREKNIITSLSPTTTTASVDSTTQTINLPVSTVSREGDAVLINNEARMIISGGATSMILDEALSAAPSTGDTVVIYPRTLSLSAYTDLGQVLKVINYSTGAELERTDDSDVFSGNVASYGEPSTYNFRRNYIHFNIAVEETTYYQVFYYALPEELSTDAATLDIPPQAHMGVVLYAKWLGHLWMQETEAAYAAKRDFVDFMRSNSTADELQSEMGRPLVHTVKLS